MSIGDLVILHEMEELVYIDVWFDGQTSATKSSIPFLGVVFDWHSKDEEEKVKEGCLSLKQIPFPPPSNNVCLVEDKETLPALLH